MERSRSKYSAIGALLQFVDFEASKSCGKVFNRLTFCNRRRNRIIELGYGMVPNGIRQYRCRTNNAKR